MLYNKNMKYESAWDMSDCQIGHPCSNCIKECTFRRDNGVDKKENKNERTIEKSIRTIEQDSYRKWRNNLLKHADEIV